MTLIGFQCYTKECSARLTNPEISLQDHLAAALEILGIYPFTKLNIFFFSNLVDYITNNMGCQLWIR